MVTVLPFLLPLWLWWTRLRGRPQPLRAGEVALLSTLELGPLLAYRRWLDKQLRVPWPFTLTHPLAGLLFTGILAQSTWRILTGRGVDWRGRRYFLNNSASALPSLDEANMPDDAEHREDQSNNV
jgi:chlorobactene glucosyltransferase